MLPLLALLPMLGAGIGAATQLNHPDRMLKNMGIGAGIGLGAGAGATALPALFGGAGAGGAGAIGTMASGAPMTAGLAGNAGALTAAGIPGAEVIGTMASGAPMTTMGATSALPVGAGGGLSGMLNSAFGGANGLNMMAKGTNMLFPDQSGSNSTIRSSGSARRGGASQLAAVKQPEFGPQGLPWWLQKTLSERI